MKVKGGYAKSYKVRLGWAGFGLVSGQGSAETKNQSFRTLCF